MKKFIIMSSFLFLGTTTKSFSLDVKSCQISNAKDLLEEIKIYHPNILAEKSYVDARKVSFENSGRLANPVLSGQVRQIEDDGKSYQFSLTQKLELGGKRMYRKQVAESAFKRQKWKSQFEIEDIVHDSVQKIYEVQQINQLLPHYREARGVYESVVKKFSLRKSLSPQEEVERETLQLAINHSRLKESELEAKRLDLLRHLSFYISEECTINPKTFQFKFSLSKLKNLSGVSPAFSKFRMSEENLKLYKRVSGLESSRGIEDVRVRTSYWLEDKNNRKENYFGLHLEIPVNIFNRNQAGRERSQVELKEAKRLHHEIEEESKIDYRFWKDQLTKFETLLSRGLIRTDFERKHSKVESLFKRGVISVGSVIESHRQLIEYLTSIHEYQLRYIESLWKLHQFHGNLLNQKFGE